MWEEEIRLLTWRQNEEVSGRGSTHFGGEHAPLIWNIHTGRKRKGEVQSTRSRCNSKGLSCSQPLDFHQWWPNLWITHSISLQICQPRPGHTGSPAGRGELTLPQCSIWGVKSAAGTPKPVSEDDAGSNSTSKQQCDFEQSTAPAQTSIPFIHKIRGL